MKKLFSLLIVPALFLFLAACENNDELTPNSSEIDPQALQAAENEAEADEVYADVDDLAYYGGIEAEGDFSGGRVAARDERNPLHNDCAVITHDKENNTIIIDFGEGCTDWKGITRSGKIIITYTARWFVPGAMQTITFEDYYVNDIHVEGVRVRENISESTEEIMEFKVSLTDGKLTWPDETFATRDAEWTIKRIRALNPAEDERHVDGYAVGTTKAGNDYNVDILETIIAKRSCGPLNYFVPVSGVKQLSINGEVKKVIDFGDGECDRIVTITVDGVTSEVTLKGLRR